MVESGVGRKAQNDYEIDARGWPLKVRVNYNIDSLITANYHLPGREMTYKITHSNS